MDDLTIRSRLGDYTVEFRDDTRWVTELAEAANTYFVVDERVWQMHGGTLLRPLAARPLHLISSTEEAKTLDGFASLCDAVIASGANRGAVLVSIGGGVVQDVTGFLTSVLYRGIEWAYVPTTLLAQADSCIGAKTSINFGHYKNLLGSMYPPARVIVHPQLVETLDEHQFFSGLGEIIKMHIVAGRHETAVLESRLEAIRLRDTTAVGEATRSSLRIKQRYIEEDEFDRGIRRMLNFGHCFGHAIESATDFSVPHGQAVVLGMVLAGLVACARGDLSRSGLDDYGARLFVSTLTSAASLDRLDFDAVIAAMRRDKKRTGPGLAVVLPRHDWSLDLATDVDQSEAVDALAELSEALSAARVLRSSVI
jgi:3-dehydroquinate synthase